jgi:hypothetical protein
MHATDEGVRAQGVFELCPFATFNALFGVARRDFTDDREHLRRGHRHASQGLRLRAPYENRGLVLNQSQ